MVYMEKIERKWNFWDEHDKLNKTPKWKRQRRVKVFEYFLNHPETTIEKMKKKTGGNID